MREPPTREAPIFAVHRSYATANDRALLSFRFGSETSARLPRSAKS
jgi:hypothetical protein